MSNQPDILKLLDLAANFNKAATAAVEENAALAAKAQSAITANEQAELQKVVTEIQTKGMQMMLSAAMGGGSEEDIEASLKNELGPQMLRIMEITAGIFNRIQSDEELAGFVPEEGRTEEVSQAFRAQGANTLARLFAPKI